MPSKSETYIPNHYLELSPEAQEDWKQNYTNVVPFKGDRAKGKWRDYLEENYPGHDGIPIDDHKMMLRLKPLTS
jgi:hypothetical protein